MVESATLTFGPLSIIVSVLGSPVPGDCTSGNPLSIGPSPNIETCPMRVALLDGSSLTVVYKADNWCYVQAMADSLDKVEFNNSNDLVFTLVTFNPAMKILSFASVDKHAAPNGTDVCYDPPLQLNF